MKKLWLLLLLLITACSKPLYSGTVTEKVYSPAHSIYCVRIIPVGKYNQVFQYWINYPDSWTVWVQNGKDRDSWTVSEEYYDSVEVGDYVELDRSE